MNLACVLSLFLLSSSLTSLAQTPGELPTRSVRTNCDSIAIKARLVDSSDIRVQPTQRVKVTLNNQKSVEIVSEQITIHGIPGGLSPASEQTEFRPEEKVGPSQESSFAISLSGLSSVRYVELNSATYADGSIWRPKHGEACMIVPGS